MRENCARNLTIPGWSHLWSQPSLMAEYLANRDRVEVEAVFDPFVELLLEVHQGDRWALFSSVLDNDLPRRLTMNDG